MGRFREKAMTYIRHDDMPQDDDGVNRPSHYQGVHDMQVITRAQREALHEVYSRDPSVARSYRAFRKAAYRDSIINCVMVRWKGMWLGIEPDGYTHS